MMEDLPSEKTIRILEAFLGENFELRHLHPWHVRFRRTHAQKSLALPSALKLTTASGRIYKLHVGDAERRFEHMTARAGEAADSGLFPEILWHDDQALLMEYIPGRRPHFSGTKFARALGHALARLHAINRISCDERRVEKGIRRDLDLLTEAGVLKNPGRYEAGLEAVKPVELLASMDYADVKPGNFLWDAKDRLRFIDVGALRANRPTGQYLCGSFYFRVLSRRVFAHAYLEAGGMPQVIEQARYLRMLNCIWAAALYIRKMQEVPGYLPFHKFGYRFLAGYLLWEFRRLAKSSKNDFRLI